MSAGRWDPPAPTWGGFCGAGYRQQSGGRLTESVRSLEEFGLQGVHRSSARGAGGRRREGAAPPKFPPLRLWPGRNSEPPSWSGAAAGCPSRAGARRWPGLIRAAGDGGSGAAALPPARARGTEPAAGTPRDAPCGACPASRCGAAQETVPGGESLLGAALCESRERALSAMHGTRGFKRWRFQRQGCRWALLFKGLFIECMLLSTDEIFYTKCKGGRLKS